MDMKSRIELELRGKDASTVSESQLKEILYANILTKLSTTSDKRAKLGQLSSAAPRRPHR